MAKNKNGFIRYWDPVAKAAYLYNADEKLFISYEDTKSIQLKTQYAIDNGLGGIMFWQLRSDAKKEGLLDAIHEVVKKD